MSDHTSAPLLAVGFTAFEISLVRRTVARHTARLGLGEDQLSDFLLAVNEVVTSTVAYGSGQGELRLWDDGGSVTCEVTERHPVGGVAGAPPLTDNRGLRMARLLVDSCDVLSSPTSTVVRVVTTFPHAELTPVTI